MLEIARIKHTRIMLQKMFCFLLSLKANKKQDTHIGFACALSNYYRHSRKFRLDSLMKKTLSRPYNK